MRQPMNINNNQQTDNGKPLWTKDRVEFDGRREIVYITVDKTKLDEYLHLNETNGEGQLIGYNDEQAKNLIRYQFLHNEIDEPADEVIFVDKKKKDQYEKMGLQSQKRVHGLDDYLPGGFLNVNGRNGVYTGSQFEQMERSLI